ncbi:hypothetical protein WUBG_17531, partial [Wuchereria bancrofti]
VVVNLVNQKGREKRVGGELDRVVLRTNLDFVRLNAFDFHKECRTLDWGRLDILKKQLRGEITEFGFFLIIYKFCGTNAQTKRIFPYKLYGLFG